jgi:hypothetical protein
MIRSCLLWIGLTVSTAHAAEYRMVHLTNGRVVPAEVKGFTPDAVTLGIPQGTMVFSPELLDKMDPLTEAEYRAQAPWRVAILEFTASTPALESEARTAHMLASRALASIPGVVSGTPADIPGDMRDADRRSLAACRTDLLCAVREGEAAGIDVVMMGQVRETSGKKELRLGALWVKYPAARKRRSIALTGALIDHRSDIYKSQHQLLFLEPGEGSLAQVPAVLAAAPTPKPVTPQIKPVTPRIKPDPTPKPKKPRTPTSQATLRGMAWAPVPGLPHIVRGDNGAFAKSFAVAGVGTAVGIGMAGKATYTKSQFVIASVLSTYTFTTLANHLFWPDKPKTQPPPK